MALGKPVVAFDLAETRHSAADCALYAVPNDELDFAVKVCWLLDRPAECERLGQLGRERVRTVLAWEHSVPHLLRAYEHTLSLKRKGAGAGARVVADRPDQS
jgi:glycosyltransferase involved in cell wall biosynthesis